MIAFIFDTTTTATNKHTKGRKSINCGKKKREKWKNLFELLNQRLAVRCNECMRRQHCNLFSTNNLLELVHGGNAMNKIQRNKWWCDAQQMHFQDGMQRRRCRRCRRTKLSKQTKNGKAKKISTEANTIVTWTFAQEKKYLEKTYAIYCKQKRCNEWNRYHVRLLVLVNAFCMKSTHTATERTHTHPNKQTTQTSRPITVAACMHAENFLRKQ